MSLDLPVVHGDDGTWGAKLNAALADLDSRVSAGAAAAASGVLICAVTGGADDAAPVQAKLDAARTAGGARVEIPFVGSGVVTIGSTLTIPSRTRLHLGAGVTLRRKSGFNGLLITNDAYTAARSFGDAAITAGATSLTSATAAFVTGDVGKEVVVYGAGPGGAPLVTTIASRTNGTTVVLATAATLTVSGAAASVGPRDKDIQITGGAGAMIDGGSNGASTGVTQHHINLRRCDRPVIRGLRATSTTGKFWACLGDVVDSNVSDLHFEAASSDGVHFEGPVYTATVERISGSTGDDTIAATPHDWSGYDDVSGDIIGLTIRDIDATSDTVPVHVIAGLNRVVRKVIIENVRGISNNLGAGVVSIGDDQTHAETMGGIVDDVRVRNISGRRSQAGSYVTITTTQGGYIEVDGIKVNTASQLYGAVYCANVGATPVSIDTLRVANVHCLSGMTTNSALVLARGTVTNLDVDGVTGSWAGNVVELATGTTVTRCSVKGVKGTGNGGALVSQGASAVQPSCTLIDIDVTGMSWLGVTTADTAFSMLNVASVLGNGMFSIGATSDVSVSSLNGRLSGTVTNSITSGGTYTETVAASPDLLVPPVSMAITPGAAAAWFSVDGIIGMRFSVPVTKTYRYVLFNVGTASGNIQVAVARLSGVDRKTYTRVADSGIIACPTAGNVRQDLGAFVLTPGEYVVTFYCDNTTAAFRHGNIGLGYLRGSLSMNSGTLAGGLPASGAFQAFTDRAITLAVEADV